MFVLAGDFKRRQVGSLPKHWSTRPILARIKKSLFDILKTRLAGAQFLDLFAGSGSVGLEALSRGAEKVIFVDANPQCAKWISKTVSEIAGENARARCSVMCRDAFSAIDSLHEKFDLVFSGAPYVDKNKSALFFIDRLLVELDRRHTLKIKGWFIAQHQQKETFTPGAHWDFFRQEKYGDTRLSFFEYVGPR